MNKPCGAVWCAWAFSLLTLMGDSVVCAEDYSIQIIRRNSGRGVVEIDLLDEYYLAVAPILESELTDPPAEEEWLFWDASSVGFKMGVPTEDFASQYTATASIGAAIDSWDDLDPDSLSITYDGEDLFETNDPDDGENIIFWSKHSSISNLSGATLITADTSGAEIGEFTDVDIALNDRRRWTTNRATCDLATADVQSTVTHELGHALGLSHATGRNAMSTAGNWCSHSESGYEDSLLQRVVTANDEDGYEYIYVNTNSIRSKFGGGAGKKPVAQGITDATRSMSSGVVVFPNPFNPEVTVSFTLDRPSHVTIAVHDLLGRRVRSLVDAPSQSVGHFQHTWDGRDDRGQKMASGTYFLAVGIDGGVESYKLTLVR